MEYKKYNSYPHIRPEDEAIWNRFIEKFPQAYDEVFYDIPVGKGAKIVENPKNSIERGYKVLTQWKIDVVAKKKNIVDIIELKPNAGLHALGQVEKYARLYKKIAPTGVKITPVLITDTLRPDMEELAKEGGTKLIIV